jgi:hypothetical protein
MIQTIVRHVILPTGLHAITTKNGHVHVLTEDEYTMQSWWKDVLIQFNLKIK